MQLTDATPTVVDVEAHARAVREKWRLRQLILTCQGFAAEGYGECGDVQAFVDRAEQAVFDLARVPEGSTVVPVRDAIHRAFEILSEASRRGGGITGIASGFTDLDRKCAGLHAGDVYIVAGRPGMGKTAFVLNMAANVARPARMSPPDEQEPYAPAVEEPGHGVAFFSLEMPREQLAARLLASEARVDLSRIRSGDIHADDWSKLTDAAARLGRFPIWIDDTPALKLLDLRAKIRRLKARIERGDEDARAQGLGLVVIDYLQLMQGRRDAASREQEISELSRGLKQLAKEEIISLMVEGGGEALGSFFDLHLVDRVCWFISPIVLGSTKSRIAVAGTGAARLDQAVRLQDTAIKKFGNSLLLQGRVSSPATK